jgi:hypothetical protein
MRSVTIIKPQSPNLLAQFFILLPVTVFCFLSFFLFLVFCPRQQPVDRGVSEAHVYGLTEVSLIFTWLATGKGDQTSSATG